jgi:hypothetical protein
MTHLLTPPEELLEHWDIVSKLGNGRNALTLAYRAGADQELEACCEWVDWKWSGIKSRELRATRRPKSPSLKEQALEAWEIANQSWTTISDKEAAAIIRRALEALDD